MNTFLPPAEHDLYFKKAVTRWDEAIPLGSGLTGALIWGDGAPLRFSLDRGDLWDVRPSPHVQAEDYTYAELIRLVQEKKRDEVLRRFDAAYRHPTPTKIPAGRMTVSFGGKARRVESRLSLAGAEATITLTYAESVATVRSFMHAEGKYGFLRVEGMTPSISLVPHDFTSQEGSDKSVDALVTASLHQLGYAPVEWLTYGNVQVALQRTADDLVFALMLATRVCHGVTEAVYYVASSRDGANWLQDAATMLQTALERGYEADMAAHLGWWDGFWSKCSIRLPDKFIEKNWYLNNYLLASCSRKGCPPMPLQGVWTADEGKLPPWKGDYHGDLNTQFSYYNFLKSDHLEEGECFLDFMWSLNDKAREFAKSFFDADGLCLPSVFAIDGTSLGGWCMYCTNITNQIWQAHIFYMYYQYTADEMFLRERLYPYLKGIEGVVRRHLSPDENGKLTLPLTSSPELHDNSQEAWLNGISNYDLALVRFLYEALCEYAPAVCPEDLGLWQDIYARLPDYAVDEQKGFKINEEENLNESHRHFSHLMMVYPLTQCQYNRSQKEKDLIDKSIWTLEFYGRGVWVGFSFAWMAQLYARARNGEGAAYQLNDFFRHLCAPNGFHLNGDFRKTGVTSMHYRPFTLESNMNAADVIQEMLMQCYDGVVRVFPAVPAAWREDGCEFEGLLSFGGIKVSAAISDELVSFVRLNPKKDTCCRVYDPFGNGTAMLTVGDASQTVVAVDGVFTLPLVGGKQYVLTAEND